MCVPDQESLLKLYQIGEHGTPGARNMVKISEDQIQTCEILIDSIEGKKRFIYICFLFFSHCLPFSFLIVFLTDSLLVFLYLYLPVSLPFSQCLSMSLKYCIW